MKGLAWKQVAVALTIGFLLGGGFGLWQARRHRVSWMQYLPDQKKEKMLQRFVDELKLTDAQKAKVKNILGSTIDQTEALRAEMSPKFRAIRDEMEREIQALLTEDQRKRFEAMETHWEARKKRWGSHPQY